MSDALDPIGSVVVVPDVASLQAQIEALDNALKTASPQMESLLQVIHRNLGADPALPHLLKEEELAVILRGLEQKTRTKIVEATVKSAASGKNKGLSKIGLDDL